MADVLLRKRLWITMQNNCSIRQGDIEGDITK